MKALIGQKLGMMQSFQETGVVLPVTAVQAGPCVITQLRTEERDGYTAVQLGYGEAKRLKKSDEGHRKAAKTNARHLREIRLTPEEADGLKVGDHLDVATFTEGDQVQVIATSKGKGFAGTVKRHNFNTGPKTHGSHNYRAPGSIGSMYPQHVFKGQKMAGRMGADRTTVKNLQVVAVDTETGILLIKGAVPGPRRGLVVIEAMPGSLDRSEERAASSEKTNDDQPAQPTPEVSIPTADQTAGGE